MHTRFLLIANFLGDMAILLFMSWNMCSATPKPTKHDYCTSVKLGDIYVKIKYFSISVPFYLLTFRPRSSKPLMHVIKGLVSLIGSKKAVPNLFITAERTGFETTLG